MSSSLCNTADMTKWQDLFDKPPGRVNQGSGFSVCLYSQGNLRYSEGERSITLLTEIIDESDQLGRKWLIFPRVRIIVYLPESLKWDDGAPVDSAAAPIVTSRIMEAIANAGESARTEVSDEVYRRAENDFANFGPQHRGQA
jgi:hypothetical protein